MPIFDFKRPKPSPIATTPQLALWQVDALVLQARDSTRIGNMEPVLITIWVFAHDAAEAIDLVVKRTASINMPIEFVMGVSCTNIPAAAVVNAQAAADLSASIVN